MLRWRALAGFLMVTLLAGVGSIVHGATAGPRRTPSGRSTSGPAKYLEIYYTSPVLVRASERVLMPVDVVCATAEGRACAASVNRPLAASSSASRHGSVELVLTSRPKR